MKTTKTITVTKTNAILGAACIALAIAGTAVVASNATISAVNEKAVAIAQAQAPRENILDQNLTITGDRGAWMVGFNRVPYDYAQVSITYSNEDGSPLSAGEFTTEITDDGLYLVADGIAPGDYQVILHADDLYPSQLSGDIVFQVEVRE